MNFFQERSLMLALVVVALMILVPVVRGIARAVRRCCGRKPQWRRGEGPVIDRKRRIILPGDLRCYAWGPVLALLGIEVREGREWLLWLWLMLGLFCVAGWALQWLGRRRACGCEWCKAAREVGEPLGHDCGDFGEHVELPGRAELHVSGLKSQVAGASSQEGGLLHRRLKGPGVPFPADAFKEVEGADPFGAVDAMRRLIAGENLHGIALALLEQTQAVAGNVRRASLHYSVEDYGAALIDAEARLTGVLKCLGHLVELTAPEEDQSDAAQRVPTNPRRQQA